jgi:hypothetical protein
VPSHDSISTAGRDFVNRSEHADLQPATGRARFSVFVFAPVRAPAEENRVSAARRLSKRQLKDDKFVDIVLLYGEKLREHQRLILGGLLALLVLVLALSWGRRALESGSTEAQQAYSAALKELESAMRVDDPKAYLVAQQSFEAVRASYGRKDVGRWATYAIGYCKAQAADYQGAEAEFRAYLEAQPKGEFALAARLGIASANGSLGRVKPQADMLIEAAGNEDVDVAQADAWRYQAAQIYMDAGYFDLARQLFEQIEARADEPTRIEIEQALKALAALPAA